MNREIRIWAALAALCVASAQAMGRKVEEKGAEDDRMNAPSGTYRDDVTGSTGSQKPAGRSEAGTRTGTVLAEFSPQSGSVITSTTSSSSTPGISTGVPPNQIGETFPPSQTVPDRSVPNQGTGPSDNTPGSTGGTQGGSDFGTDLGNSGTGSDTGSGGAGTGTGGGTGTDGGGTDGTGSGTRSGTGSGSGSGTGFGAMGGSSGN